MATSPEISRCFDDGDLESAIRLSTVQVRQRPTDITARAELAELLCFSGDLERADKQLDVVEQQEPSVGLGVSLFRQLIRAEEARQQFYSECRLPEFLDAPTAADQLYLKAAVAQREGDDEQASRLLMDAEAERPRRRGVADGTEFDDLRDLDDLSAAHFDVLTSTGKFFWVPIRMVERLSFHKPQHRRDLLWPRATLEVANRPAGEVFFAALYPLGKTAPTPALLLGRETAFTGGDGQAVRGLGLRSYLVGEESRAILDLGTLEFAPVE